MKVSLKYIFFCTSLLTIHFITELGGVLPTPDTVINKASKRNDMRGNLINDHPCCSNGCSLFDKNDFFSLTCNNCKADRYKHQKELDSQIEGGNNSKQLIETVDSGLLTPNQLVSIVSVGAALTEFLLDDETRELFNYRSDYVNNIREDGIYRDLMDGAAYKSLEAKGLFQNPEDIAVMLFVDGFPLPDKPTHSLTIVNCLIVNLDPSIR